MAVDRRKVKVLIADDSVVYRTQLRNAVQMIDYVEVVGVAANGRLAVDKLAHFPVDLLILDLEMPELNGLQTLQEIRNRGIQVKTLLFSSHSKRGAEITMEALRLGASDFLAKPGSDGSTSAVVSNSASIQGVVDPAKRIQQLIQPKIEALFPVVSVGEVASSFNQVQLNREISKTGFAASASSAPKVYPKIIWEAVRPKVLVIGSSTGGPSALEKLFSTLIPPFNIPILITQHMPAIFTAALAERLGKILGVGKKIDEVREGRHGEKLLPNRIYVAPGDFHMSLKQDGEDVVIELDQGPPENFVRPAVDPLFRTAAKIFRSNTIGVVLTGMGSDGKLGADSIKSAGGTVIIQNRESCVVYGMPGAVESVGAFDLKGDLEFIGQLISQKISLDSSLPNKTLAGS